MYKTIVLIIVLISLLIFGLQIDDELKPQSQALLEQWKKSQNSEAYFHLMGIMAASDENPIQVGKRLFESYQSALSATRTSGESFWNDEYPAEKKLPAIDGSFLCGFFSPDDGEKDCLLDWFAPSLAITELLAKHQTLFERYQYFIGTDDYATLHEPSIKEPFIDYQYLSQGNDLMLLNSIEQARRGEYKTALNGLQQNIRSLRKQLARQDTLVGKMMFLYQISKNLDIAVIVGKNVSESERFKVEPLSAQEKSLSLVMSREYYINYGFLIDLLNNPEDWEGMNFSPWLGRWIFKPNMTANTVYPVYRQIIDDNLLSHQAFAEQMKNPIKPKPQFSWLRNIGAEIVFQFGTPNYYPYLGRLFDLDAKIQLYNAYTSGTPAESIKNPYYGEQHNAYRVGENQSLCFDGPFEENQKYRCLRIAL